MSQHPSPYPSSAFSELTAETASGTFRRYDAASELPSALSRVAGQIEESDYRATLLAHGTTTDHPATIHGITPAPHSSICSVTVFRSDVANPRNTHFNRDEIVVFQDSAGKSWQFHTKDVPGHSRRFSTESGLPEVNRLYQLPIEASGPLDALKDLYGRK